jgi:hypothetical protein
MDEALWRLHFADGNMCVAESGPVTYLVLFTTPERAEEFMYHRNPVWGPHATPALYSATRDEFMSVAGKTAADGIDGVVIDPERDGQVLAIIDFCREEADFPVPLSSEDLA